ncbi:MAG TPA: hypothetical protein PKA28_11010 [Methylomusa anaerophila]|uniref:Uncharacterized protein n=1 Tax=Methylomusa anaerophila TaxID=1930071 RepID=A0A348AJ40_9FIRM|nr:hypothetical protein [Methylomusa anaerophila]BBB91088.1 hypothetical protein MAMMFC1_01756 [Methylomusa anaerophila]HML88965.1 hypothetical protein [Methylomusa anaerophila]
MKQNLKNILTGGTMQPGDFEYDWQEFANNRQKLLKEKILTDKLSGEYINCSIVFNEVLEQVDNNDLTDLIRNVAITRESIANYIHYNHGFLDGLKLALSLRY